MTLARAVRTNPGLLMLAILLAAVGCSNSSTAPSSIAAYAQTDLLLGTGDEAVSGSTVSVDYTGWLYDPTKPELKGLQFDTSAGRTPLSFTIGSGAVIAGLDRGVVGMKVGGMRRLVIPPSLGYGATRIEAIPPNSTLVFDITLVSVQ